MAEKSPRSSTGCSLPLARVKTIMKSSPEVSNIAGDSLFMIAKSAELFIQDLALQTLEGAENKHHVKYSDLAEIVNENESLQFLQDIIPRKVKAREYFAMMGKEFPTNGQSILSSPEKSD